MITRFLWPTAVAALAAVSICVLAGGAGSPPETDGLGFLEPGADYFIRFPERSSPFKSTASGVTSTSYTGEDGETYEGGPARWSMTLTLEIFRVVRLSRGSWALLEHPSDPDDFTKWGSKRRAMAILADPKAKDAPGVRERLKALKEDAEIEIPTSETWVNLAHAVAITSVRTEESAKLSVKSAKVNLEQ